MLGFEIVVLYACHYELDPVGYLNAEIGKHYRDELLIKRVTFLVRYPELVPDPFSRPISRYPEVPDPWCSAYYMRLWH